MVRTFACKFYAKRRPCIIILSERVAAYLPRPIYRTGLCLAATEEDEDEEDDTADLPLATPADIEKASGLKLSRKLDSRLPAACQAVLHRIADALRADDVKYVELWNTVDGDIATRTSKDTDSPREGVLEALRTGKLLGCELRCEDSEKTTFQLVTPPAF